MGVGEMGVGEMGVGEMGSRRNGTNPTKQAFNDCVVSAEPTNTYKLIGTSQLFVQCAGVEINKRNHKW